MKKSFLNIPCDYARDNAGVVVWPWPVGRYKSESFESELEKKRYFWKGRNTITRRDDLDFGRPPVQVAFPRPRGNSILGHSAAIHYTGARYR